MDIITLTRQLGAEIQKQDVYKKFMEAKNIADNDVELQSKIGEFNLLKMSLDNERFKEDANQETVDKLNEKIVEMYNEISNGEIMKAYFSAMNEYKALTDQIMNILAMCQNGEDPETCEPPSACNGNCSSCGGCH